MCVQFHATNLVLYQAILAEKLFFSVSPISEIQKCVHSYSITENTYFQFYLCFTV
jgi:hypothetical protein